ncbi:hypothetical protein ACJMK2_000116, partial [Sinanodonta woodiana]
DYRHEICENYFRKIRDHLKDKPSRFHLVEEDFAIDNTVVDSKLEGLKRKIVEVASRQPYWGEEIPARWLPLEQVLMNLRAQGHKVIHRSLLENMNQAGGVQISTDELDLFLRFQHEIGTILYFSTELLKEKIVLEPQWMINALKSLITAEMFVLRHALSVTTLWYEFKNGILYPELVDALWTKDADLHDNKVHILLLMEQLNIIAKPTLYIDDESDIKEVNYFFAPCMLHVEPPREVIFPEPHEQMASSSVMCYVFTGKFLPAPIFHRLLAACIAQWPLATKKMEKTIENQIFCGCGVFQIDNSHKLTLHFSGYIIFMRVTRQGIKDKTPCSKLCIEVKEFIARVLNKVIGYLGHSLKFEEFIQCPEYNGESVNSLIPVDLLKENEEVHCDFHDNMIESNKVLKFWFDGQEQSGESDVSSAGPMPSAPISDKDRFMCIAYLLNDVGSKVLRQLLHDMVTPTCTLDQHFANNRRKIDKLLKKKVLNASQMDIMFPPNGDPTNLTDYDITLLSALFNNIMPSLGIQEKDLIKSLRENRNKLYGHTKSCKMNASDFQTCWSDISSTLITLSQQCGDTKFKNEISVEIKQTQVPDVSYLSMIHTLYSRIERLESSKASTSET